MVEKKSVPKKKSAVKKKATIVQKKKSPVKKAATSKVKKTVTKKVTKKPAVKSKPKVSSVKKTVTTKAKTSAAKPKATTTKPSAVKTKVTKSIAREPVKKSLKSAIADVKIDVKTKKGSKPQNEKVVKVIDNLSLTKELNYVTTVPGVFRKVPSVQRSAGTPVHKNLPITGILNYIKGIF